MSRGCASCCSEDARCLGGGCRSLSSLSQLLQLRQHRVSDRAAVILDQQVDDGTVNLGKGGNERGQRLCLVVRVEHLAQSHMVGG